MPDVKACFCRITFNPTSTNLILSSVRRHATNNKELKMRKLRKALLFSCLAIVGAAEATIIDRGDYLTDTSSGLDWLDVNKTVNMTRTQVRLQLRSGGNYDGWRFASGIEFNELISNYTGTHINPTNYGNVEHSDNKIFGLIGMLGSTCETYYQAEFGASCNQYSSAGNERDFVYGWLSDVLAINNTYQYHYAFIIDFEDNTSKADYTVAHQRHAFAAYRSASLGAFLVREAVDVPEPSSVLLIIAASIGLVFLKTGKNVSVFSVH